MQRVLHGSCRKPYNPSKDGLRRVDAEIRACESASENRPALLLLTGYLVYVDDVAGLMLHAIHQLDARLGLFNEVISGAVVKAGSVLVQHEDRYNRRMRILPRTRLNATLIARFFGGARKPVFTTANAQNHLVVLSQVIAKDYQQRYQEQISSGLDRVA